MSSNTTKYAIRNVNTGLFWGPSQLTYVTFCACSLDDAYLYNNREECNLDTSDAGGDEEIVEVKVTLTVVEKG